MSDNWQGSPSRTATLDPRNLVWEAPPEGPVGPPPAPPETPGSEPPARRRSRAFAAVMVIAVLLGFLGVSRLRSSSSPSDTALFNPFSPATTSPAGSSSSAQSSTPSSVSGTSALSSSEIDAVATKVDQGVVDIDTVLGYEDGRAAGTGMVLTSSGEILTNNHVIAGATKITVTVVTTGKTYTAKVVGTAPTEDVAVLQLEGASGLKTISTAKLSSVNVGDAVVAVGNAGGKGGTPSVATGQVTRLSQAITASDPGGANAQRLTGLIEVDAPIQPGDSGGPLANRNGDVIGMDSAADVSGTRFRNTTNFGYAIPIDKALTIAGQIASGNGSSTVHIGLPAFLGVQLSGRSFASGAAITGVEKGTPASSIGLTAGSVVTAVNGQPVGSASTLSSLLQAQHPGDRVSISWTDTSGDTHTATATLIAGPAD